MTRLASPSKVKAKPKAATKPIPRKSTGEEILDFFTGHGLTRAQAAGIVGNLKQESGLNAAEPGGYLAQWLGSRLTGLEHFAAQKGVTAKGNKTVQLEYIWQELRTTEKATLTKLIKAKTPQESARIFSESFERPSEPDLPNREKYATEAYGPGLAHLEAENADVKAGENETVNTGPTAGITNFLEKELWPKVGELALTAVLLIAGAVLVVYGIMVSVRPADRALSIPIPSL